MGKTKLAAPDRRHQLVSIAMDQIAKKGFEGLRFQEVAKQAGINNATLYYHFPTKEGLIQGVVSHLMEEVKKRRHRPKEMPASAREELRLEFEDLRALLRKQPKLFIVLTELSLRGLREAILSKMESKRDSFWRDYLSGILRRGVEQGVFRRDINIEVTVSAIMAQFKGIGYHATLGKRKSAQVDKVIIEIASQLDNWLTSRSK